MVKLNLKSIGYGTYPPTIVTGEDENLNQVSSSPRGISGKKDIHAPEEPGDEDRLQVLRRRRRCAEADEHEHRDNQSDSSAVDFRDGSEKDWAEGETYAELANGHVVKMCSMMPSVSRQT